MVDELGTRMKQYEFVETERRFLPMLPIVARIDGRGFSKFTKGMKLPFDEKMSTSMVSTTSYLVKETQAILGYTQSDEINLVWYKPEYKSSVFFDRKIQKLVSVLAGLATVAFTQALIENFENWQAKLKKMPHFDARVIQLPTLDEAANMFVWRNIDAAKNAVSMAAHSVFSHKSLQNMGKSAMQERLFQEAGINFNDYTEAFKRGTFVRKKTFQRCLTEDERNKIPEKNRPDVGELFTRSQIECLSVPPLTKVKNKVEFIFYGNDPELYD